MAEEIPIRRDDDDGEVRLYDEYPVIGLVECVYVGCNEVLPIHARLEVSAALNDEGYPVLGFNAQCMPDAIALHMLGHGVTPQMYYGNGWTLEADEEDEDDG